MTIHRVHRAFSSAVQGLNLGIPIAWENHDFDPDNDKPFCAVSLIPGDAESLGKGEFESDEILGVYQMSFYQPAGEGVREPYTLADTATAFFKHNRKLTDSGQVVSIINTERNAGRNVGGWFVLDVSISWRAYIGRV